MYLTIIGVIAAIILIVIVGKGMLLYLNCNYYDKQLALSQIPEGDHIQVEEGAHVRIYDWSKITLLHASKDSKVHIDRFGRMDINGKVTVEFGEGNRISIS